VENAKVVELGKQHFPSKQPSSGPSLSCSKVAPRIFGSLKPESSCRFQFRESFSLEEFRIA
jgi:hypothetical protein